MASVDLAKPALFFIDLNHNKFRCGYQGEARFLQGEVRFLISFQVSFIVDKAEEAVLGIRDHFIENDEIDLGGIDVPVKTILVEFECVKDGEVFVPDTLELTYNINRIKRMISTKYINNELYMRIDNKIHHFRKLHAGKDATPEDLLFMFVAVSNYMMVVAQRYRLHQDGIIRNGCWHSQLPRVLGVNILNKTTSMIRYLKKPEIRKELISAGREIMENGLYCKYSLIGSHSQDHVLMGEDDGV